MAITLLEMLLNAGMLTPGQCDEALQNRVFFGGKIGTNLIELDFLEEESLARFLSRKLAVPLVHPDRLLDIPGEMTSLLSPDLATKYRVIPLELDRKRLSLVMADPSDLRAIDEISFITGFIISPMVAPEVRLVQALGKYYRFEISERFQQIIEKLGKRKEKGWDPGSENITREMAGSAQAAPTMTNFVEKDVGSPEKAADKNTSVEDETWIERIERYSVDNVSKTLAMAVDREEVAEAVINCLGEEFERGALFLVRSDTACGWKAVCRGEEIEGFELLHIPLSQPSVLRTVAEGRNYYLGPLVDTTLNRRIAAGIGGGEPGPVLVMPLLIRDRVVNIFVMEGGKKDLGEYLPQMQRLLTKTVLAFEILIAREKILMT